MRKLNGIISTCMLALLSASASADLILDNQLVITNITGIAISPSSGDIMITTATQDYSVTRTPVVDGDVAINSFTPSSISIDVNQSVLLSWTTVNADTCTASDGTGNWGDLQITRPDGSQSIAITSEGTHTFTLSCDGTNGPASRSVHVTASVPTPDTNTKTCTSGPLSGGSIHWNDFWGMGFPGPTYDNKSLLVLRAGYQAIEFNTGNIDDHGGMISVANTYTNGRRLGAISECKGDFDVEPECTHIWGSRGGIGWATDAEPGYCQLKSDTTYYFNVTFTDGFDSSTSECELNESCRATIQHLNYD